MADRDDFDDLLRGLDQPVAPRAAFAEGLRTRLLAELSRPASSGEDPIMQTSPLPAEAPPRALNQPRRPHWLTTAFEIAAALVLLFSFWQFADRFFGSPDIGPGDHALQAALTQPAATLPAGVVASPVTTAAPILSAMAGGDPGRTGAQPGPAPAGTLHARTVPRNESEYNRGGAAPVAVDGVLYRVASIQIGVDANGGVRTETHLEARDLATGTLKWSVAADITGGPAVADGRVFVFVAYQGEPHWGIEAYSTASGRLLWKEPMFGWIASMTGYISPVVLNGVVYGAGPNGVAIAVDQATGKELWRSTALQTSDVIKEQSTPGIALQSLSPFAVADGHLYLFNAHGDLGALKLSDGSLAWSFNVAERFGPVTSLQLVAADGRVMVAAHAVDSRRPEDATTQLYAFSGATGDLIWDAGQPNGISVGIFSMAVANDKLIVALSTYVMGTPLANADARIAYNLSDGVVAWRSSDFADRGISDFAVAGADVYFTDDGQLIELDSQTGAATMIYDRDPRTGDSSYTPVISDGLIVIDYGNGQGGLSILTGSAPSAPAASPVVAAAMAGGDPGRAGQQIGPAPAGRLQTQLVETGNTESKYGTLAPVALGETLYRVAPIAIGGNADGGSKVENHLEARDITTGALKWSVAADVDGSPAVADGWVFIFVQGKGDSPKWGIEAHDASDGHLLWTAPLTGWISGLSGALSPIADHGVVYATGTDGVAFAFNAATGAEIWRSTALQTTDILGEQAAPGIALQNISQFAIADGHLYLFNAHGDLGALNLSDGSLAWSFNFAERYGPVTSLQLVAFEHQVIVAAHAVDSPSLATLTTQLLAFSGASGDLEWTQPLHAGFDGVTSMAVADGKIVVALGADVLGTPVPNANTIEAYNLDDGTAAWTWSWPNGGDQQSRPILAAVGTNVYFTGRGGVVSIDAATGKGAVISDPITFKAQNIEFTVSTRTLAIADKVIVVDLGATSGQLAILSTGADTP